MSAPELTWVDEHSCKVGNVTFRTRRLPETPSEEEQSWERATFVLVKPKPLVERYAELIAELEPRSMVELGIFEGGSTVLLSELARPDRLVALDRSAPESPALKDYIDEDGRAEKIWVFDDVDQSDRLRLREIAEEAFGGDSLDLVFDDCSHFYEPTRDSFNELFPLLRPGGVYAIEDWRWAHTPLGANHPEGFWPEEIPLTRLIFEITMAIPSFPGLIKDIRVNLHTIEVTRGDAVVDPASFDISECSNQRGRNLLSPA